MKNKKIKLIGVITATFISVTAGILSVSAAIGADHESSIEWDQSWRMVSANTQAYQINGGNNEKTNIDSYSRARFEHWFSSYGDSGRVWSTNAGRSYAYSEWELYKALDSGVAKTYWGT